MEKSRKAKKGILIALLLIVVALSVGFAAYQSNLTIKATATVKGDTASFSVRFSASQSEAIGGTPVYDSNGYAQGGEFSEGPVLTLTNLKANFTAPGQTATWLVYAFNNGKFDAFLNSVNVGAITCTAAEGTDQTKVDLAASGISVKVTVGSKEFTEATTTLSSTHKLGINTGEPVLVTLTYAAGSQIADGDFNVSIGDIVLNYESVDKSGN